MGGHSVKCLGCNVRADATICQKCDEKVKTALKEAYSTVPLGRPPKAGESEFVLYPRRDGTSGSDYEIVAMYKCQKCDRPRPGRAFHCCNLKSPFYDYDRKAYLHCSTFCYKTSYLICRDCVLRRLLSFSQALMRHARKVAPVLDLCEIQTLVNTSAAIAPSTNDAIVTSTIDATSGAGASPADDPPGGMALERITEMVRRKNSNSCCSPESREGEPSDCAIGNAGNESDEGMQRAVVYLC
jgi:hypothetical protein